MSVGRPQTGPLRRHAGGDERDLCGDRQAGAEFAARECEAGVAAKA